MGRHLVRSLLLWLPLAVVITVAAGMSFGLEQQALREGANDPQIQLAEDAAARLEAGDAVGTVVSTTAHPVDIARSLAPFVLVFNLDEAPLASTGTLDGVVPVPPQGVSASARSGEDQVTWQPRDGVRIAAVVVAYRGGTVLAGRSLREVERREDDVLATTAVLWAVGLALSWIAVWVALAAEERLGRGSRRSPHAAP